jgi:RNA polymerase sigma-70 factor (ECF subfamily)
VPAVKAALHRGREVLRELGEASTHAERKTEGETKRASRQISPGLVRYASLFNAHDWDGIRAMLSDDVRLDLVSRRKAAGRRDVGAYFTNYERASDWRLSPAWFDGREVLAVFSAASDERPRYVIELSFIDDRVQLIRDFRYVPYITQEGTFEPIE